MANPVATSAKALPGDGIGVLNLSDQEVSPQLRQCLKHHLLGECLKSHARSEINHDISNAWRNFLYNQITSGALYSTHGIGLYMGVQIGGKRIDPDEVMSDPNKEATDQKLGGNAVWVKHEFELLPQAGYGFNPKDIGKKTGQAFYGGLASYNAILRIVKRHPMDSTYNNSFWGYTRQDIKIIEQAFPMYLRITSRLNGQGLLPGEAIELERYGTVALGVGPNLSLIGTNLPVSITQFQAGLYADAGILFSFAFGHFRTKVEKQTDGLLRVTLERVNQNSEKIQGEIGTGFALGPISYVWSLLHLEAGVIHTRERILDYVVDPSYPAARKALHQAYLGSFIPMQKLATQAGSGYQGVRPVDRTNVKETEHEREFRLLGLYNRGSSDTEANVRSAPARGHSPDSQLAIAQMDEHRATFRSNKRLEIQIQTDDRNPNPSTDRFLSVKFQFSTKNAKPDELREFLVLARRLAPSSEQPKIRQWLNRLQTDHPKKKRGNLTAYFYLGVDPQAVSSIFDGPVAQEESQLLVSWARALGLPDPEAWATMSRHQQDEEASALPGVEDHLEHLRRFTRAIRLAATQSSAKEQAKVFTKSIRGTSYDLFPIAALALSCHRADLLALERLTLAQNGQTRNLDFSSLGNQYSFPEKSLN